MFVCGIRNAVVVVFAAQRIRSVRVWDTSLLLLRLLSVVVAIHVRVTLIVRALTVGLRHAVVEVVVLSTRAVLLEPAHGANLRVAGRRTNVSTRGVGKRTLVHVHPTDSIHRVDAVLLHFVLIELVLLILVLLIVVVVVSAVVHLLLVLLLLLISRLRLLTTTLLLLLRLRYCFLSTLLRRRLRGRTGLLLLVRRAPGAGGAFRRRRRLRRAARRSLRSVLR